ncbi:ABC transporter ATP-binding protein [Calidifontibacillus erzurumensis]|uniref:ABC transporter ATP-binding protein n=1 Tax=Calidifontibacillus erzurumensis TaxID=2741433 RepID=A0A8J8GG81_9BACI|nr:ABC transporter ATP-binding protein [Calidifontibacillus erzurumensis]NSL52812.1 ABC transporter ATP-binding protein [Calidifontibacillus erzurumensis]
MTVIECRELTKSYRKKHALHNLTFSIERNTITGLIGRNGAGKTTLLKIIAGFYKQTSGEILVFGEKPFNNLKVSQNMIFIDDQIIFPPALSLSDILVEAGRFYPNWDMTIAKGLFDYFSLDPKQYHQNLSKGMKSTFNAIIGIAARVPLTIFDEPTTGMDAAVRKDFYRALLKDYLEHPRTILLSSHHLNEVEDLLEHILLIDEGEKRLHMTVDDLKQYAIAVSGPENLIDEWALGKEILYKKQVGAYGKYVVLKNDFTDEMLTQAKQKGLQITAVSAEDVCMYMTNKRKGGVDDVFSKR